MRYALLAALLLAGCCPDLKDAQKNLGDKLDALSRLAEVK